MPSKAKEAKNRRRAEAHQRGQREIEDPPVEGVSPTSSLTTATGGGKQRNPTDRDHHLEHSNLHLTTGIIYSFLPSLGQAYLRSTSWEMWSRFNTAVYMEHPIGCAIPRSGVLELKLHSQPWFPYGPKKFLRNNPYLERWRLSTLQLDYHTAMLMDMDYYKEVEKESPSSASSSPSSGTCGGVGGGWRPLITGCEVTKLMLRCSNSQTGESECGTASSCSITKDEKKSKSDDVVESYKFSMLAGLKAMFTTGSNMKGRSHSDDDDSHQTLPKEASRSELSSSSASSRLSEKRALLNENLFPFHRLSGTEGTGGAFLRVVELDLSSPTLGHIRKVGSGILKDTFSLKQINLSGLSGVEIIGSGFLSGAKELQRVSLRSMVHLKTIESSVLDRCPKLMLVDLDGLGELEDVGDNFCMHCGSLTQVVGLESLKSLRRIGMNAFSQSLDKLSIFSLGRNLQHLHNIGPGTLSSAIGSSCNGTLELTDLPSLEHFCEGAFCPLLHFSHGGKGWKHIVLDLSTQPTIRKWRARTLESQIDFRNSPINPLRRCFLECIIGLPHLLEIEAEAEKRGVESIEEEELRIQKEKIKKKSRAGGKVSSSSVKDRRFVVRELIERARSAADKNDETLVLGTSLVIVPPNCDDDSQKQDSLSTTAASLKTTSKIHKPELSCWERSSGKFRDFYFGTAVPDELSSISRIEVYVDSNFDEDFNLIHQLLELRFPSGHSPIKFQVMKK